MPGDDPVLNLGGSAAAVAAGQAGMAAISKKTASGKGVDSGQLGFWVPSGGPFSASVAVALVAAQIKAIRFIAPRSTTITKIVFVVEVAATADDPCDLGIYSANGQTLLGSTGSGLGRLNSTGLKTVNLLAGVPLVSGAIYYIALGTGAIGGTGAQLRQTTNNFNLFTAFGSSMGLAEQGAAGGGVPLPAALTLGVSSTAPILALLE